MVADHADQSPNSKTSGALTDMRRSVFALFFLGVAALGLYSVYPSGVSYPYQTFSESLTTLGTLTVTWVEGTVTLGSVCGNVPWDMNNLTAHCAMMPVPEYRFTQLVLLVGCFLAIVTLEVYWRRTHGRYRTISQS